MSLINFRGHLLKKLIDKNYEVIACAPDEDKETRIKLKEMGVKLIKYNLSRRGLSPFGDLKSIIELYKIINSEKPNHLIAYTIKPVIYGSLSGWLAGVKNIYSIITGLGYLFIGNSLKQKAVRVWIKKLYQISLNRNKKIFFQNDDDISFFLSEKIIRNKYKAIKINGSGVDLKYYFRSKPIIKPIKFLIVARLLKEKGVLNFLDAAQNIKIKSSDTFFEIVGWQDNGPSAISIDKLNEMQNKEIIKFFGYQNDVRKFYEHSSVFVLPSYREGTPRTSLEAMSMGKPIITTDAPGCKETVIENYNGFLVPVNDTKKLQEAMEKFILNPGLIVEMGEKSRKLAKQKFDVEKVNGVLIKELEL